MPVLHVTADNITCFVLDIKIDINFFVTVFYKVVRLINYCISTTQRLTWMKLSKESCARLTSLVINGLDFQTQKHMHPSCIKRHFFKTFA